MRVIISGTRKGCKAMDLLEAVFASGFKITEVVHGGAPGVDFMGKRLGDLLDLPITEFPADWQTHGLAAGPIRNRQMGDYADALIALPSKSGSTGTQDMIRYAKSRGLHIHVHEVA